MRKARWHHGKIVCGDLQINILRILINTIGLLGRGRALVIDNVLHNTVPYILYSRSIHNILLVLASSTSTQ